MIRLTLVTEHHSWHGAALISRVCPTGRSVPLLTLELTGLSPQWPTAVPEGTSRPRERVDPPSTEPTGLLLMGFPPMVPSHRWYPSLALHVDTKPLLRFCWQQNGSSFTLTICIISQVHSENKCLELFEGMHIHIHARLTQTSVWVRPTMAWNIRPLLEQFCLTR